MDYLKVSRYRFDKLKNYLNNVHLQLHRDNITDRESILEYARLVGKRCAHRMLYLKM